MRIPTGESVGRPPAGRPTAGFGPEVEVTLNDLHEYRGSDLLDLDAARTLDLTRDFEKWPREQQTLWLQDNGVDLMLDHLDQWGLVTPHGNRVKLVRVDHPLWEQPSLEQLGRELSRPHPRVQTRVRLDITIYLLGIDATPPLTFAFQTANGARGLLQLTRLTEQPNSARLRLKVATTSAEAPVECRQ